jgi:alpha-galactosidase/6-phospho-beta-glucosidase family protein
MDLAEYLFCINHFGYATRIRQQGAKAELTRQLTEELERYLAEKAINTPYEPPESV